MLLRLQRPVEERVVKAKGESDRPAGINWQFALGNDHARPAAIINFIL